ncbi:hypothetical protein B0H13DRAFT_1855325 [Mycena leptocephala]|nr:hypothetical protein B0H13DRAFT_1855325 [Mycena leptocephala]
MLLNTAQELSHGPHLVAYHEEGREDMLEVLRGSNDNKDEFESGFRPQHPLGETEHSFHAHRKSTAMAIVGSQPTMRDATPSSADEIQLKRPENGGGLDSPKEPPSKLRIWHECEPGEDVVMGKFGPKHHEIEIGSINGALVRG